MNRTLLSVAAIGLAVTSIVSCSDKSATAPDGIVAANASTDAYRRVASVSVSLLPTSVMAGDSAVATVVLRDHRGRIVTGSVTWSTSASSIATVSAAGLVRSVAAGTASIKAIYGSKTGSATLTVTTPVSIAAVASVTVSLASSTISPGQTTQGTAIARDANNNILTGRVITWAASNAVIATVSASGLVTAIAAGSATVTATSETKSGSSAITVSAATPAQVASVSVSPPSASVPVGGTQQLSAVTRDANNNVLTGRVVTWSSANPAIASVGSTGLVIAVSAGSVQITAMSETKPGTSAITVTASSGTGWRAHEPSGLTTITDEPFSALPSNGWRGYYNYDLASDATGLRSPGSAFEIIYPAGMAGGKSPGLTEIGFSGRRTLYVAMYTKHSTNFQGHNTEVNKIIHLWVGGSNHLFLSASGSGSGTLRGQIRLQGIAGGGNYDGGTAGIYDNGVPLVRGAWHLLEMIAVANTGSNKDGSVTLYVDGVLAATCSGIEFEANSPTWNDVKLDPTWGGIGDVVTSTMSLRVDHIYMSGN